MAKQVTLFKALIASPGDVVDERDAVVEVIYNWNMIQGDSHMAMIEPVRWETHARPDFGDRPQEFINRQLVDNCDFLIGAFWTRLGTSTGDYASGTVEEIQGIVESGKNAMLYFSDKPVAMSSVDLKEYERLGKFKAEIKSKALYSEYSDISEFKMKLDRDLSRLMHILAPVGGFRENYEIEKVKSSDTPDKDFIDFKNHIDSLSIQWSILKASEPLTLDEGKSILSDVKNSIIAAMISNAKNKIAREDAETLKEAATYSQRLQEHEVYLDGGVSYDEFWSEGDKIFHNIKSVVEPD